MELKNLELSLYNGQVLIGINSLVDEGERWDVEEKHQQGEPHLQELIIL